MQVLYDAETGSGTSFTCWQSVALQGSKVVIFDIQAIGFETAKDVTERMKRRTVSESSERQEERETGRAAQREEVGTHERVNKFRRGRVG